MDVQISFLLSIISRRMDKLISFFFIIQHVKWEWCWVRRKVFMSIYIRSRTIIKVSCISYFNPKHLLKYWLYESSHENGTGWRQILHFPSHPYLRFLYIYMLPYSYLTKMRNWISSPSPAGSSITHLRNKSFFYKQK
jgi:hypothetical protein